MAEQRSFSSAARQAGVTQSAVSQSIGQLESLVGALLIDRSKRPLILTAAGQEYWFGVRDVVQRYQDTEARTRLVAEKSLGQLTDLVKIGAIYSVGLSYMPEATEAFGQLNPQVSVRTTFGSRDRVEEMVESGQVDLGLISFAKQTRTIGMIPWLVEPMRLVCSAKHALATHSAVGPDQLRGAEVVGFEKGLQIRKAVDACLLAAGISVQTSMGFDNVDSIIRAIQRSDGMGFLPEAAVRRETADGRLKIVGVQGLQMSRPLGIIYRRGAALPHAAAEFGSMLLGRDICASTGRKGEATPSRAAAQRPREAIPNSLAAMQQLPDGASSKH